MKLDKNDTGHDIVIRISLNAYYYDVDVLRGHNLQQNLETIEENKKKNTDTDIMS